MQRIGLILDSTTIIPDEMMSKYDVGVVSLNVVINGETKHEVDVTDEEVVSHLEDVKSMKSSSPSAGDFIVCYEAMFAKGYQELVVMPLSKNNSGTYQAAIIAREMMGPEFEKKIFVVDTLINNFGLANLVMTMIPFLDDEKCTGKMFFDEATDRANHSKMLFHIVDLKHLYRGGRLSMVACAMGILFKVKAVIEMTDGRLKLANKVRTFKAVEDIFMESISYYAMNFDHVSCRVISLSNDELAHNFEKRILSTFKNVTVTFVNRVKPVFHIHLGNNGIGSTCTAWNDKK